MHCQLRSFFVAVASQEAAVRGKNWRSRANLLRQGSASVECAAASPRWRADQYTIAEASSNPEEDRMKIAQLIGILQCLHGKDVSSRVGR